MRNFATTQIGQISMAVMAIAAMYILLNSVIWLVCIGACIMMVLSHKANN